MSQKTTIEWVQGSDGERGATWNPIRGCSRISPGCGGGGAFSGAHGEQGGCYAEGIAARFSGPGQPFEGFAEMTPEGPRWTRKVALIPELLDAPLRVRKPTTFFISMSDLFHEALTNEEIAAVFGVMGAASAHTFQILTKRSRRLPEWFEWVQRVPTGLSTIPFAPALVCAVEAHGRTQYRWTVPHPRVWPLPNAHLGVSVESRKFLSRLDHLRATPAVVRFASLEPLLEDLGEMNLASIDQVIAGSESGHGARPMHEDWVRSIRDQAARQGARFFYKQCLNERGRKVSLPLLDGRTWAEMPEKVRA